MKPPTYPIELCISNVSPLGVHVSGLTVTPVTDNSPCVDRCGYPIYTEKRSIFLPCESISTLMYSQTCSTPPVALQSAFIVFHGPDGADNTSFLDAPPQNLE